MENLKDGYFFLKNIEIETCIRDLDLRLRQNQEYIFQRKRTKQKKVTLFSCLLLNVSKSLFSN